MKRFTNQDKENAEVQRQWREMNLVALTEEQMIFLDHKLSEFDHVSTRHNLLRYLVHAGAAKWIDGGGGTVAINQSNYEIEMHKLDQWGRWRARVHPFDMAAAISKLSEEKGEVVKEKVMVSAGLGRGEFEYPADEINPEDIPF